MATVANLEHVRASWCEHGWTWWQLHILTGVQAFLGCLGWIAFSVAPGHFPIVSPFLISIGGWIYFLPWFWLGLMFIFMTRPRPWFLLMGASASIGTLLVYQEATLALIPAIGTLWILGHVSSSGSVEKRLQFFMSAQAFAFFRLALSIALFLDLGWHFQGQDLFYEAIQVALAMLLLLNGWLWLVYQRSWPAMAQLMVLMSLIWLCVAYHPLSRGSSELPIMFMVPTLIASWNLRLWPSRRAQHARQEIIFFDEECSVCQGAVAFVLVEDLRTTPFFFASQKSDLFKTWLQEKKVVQEPTVYLINDQGDLLCRIDALEYILRSLGGGWLLLAWIISKTPRRLSKMLYVLYTRWVHWRKRFHTQDSLCAGWPHALRYRLIKDTKK